MPESIDLEHIDALATGAVGEPGEREFYIQARTASTQLTVLVEKEQVALLATEAVAFLDRIAADFPEDAADPVPPQRLVDLREPTVPLFRARLIGLGFDPDRERVLIELREQTSDEEDEAETATPAVPDDAFTDGEPEGYVARIYATRSQVRAMAAHGAATVAAGRPSCPLCDMPMDPSGHRCPRWN